MSGVSPLFLAVVVPAASVPITLQTPSESVFRETLNPVSLLELSVQDRVTWVGEVARAVRSEGELGTVAEAVVALA